MNSSSLDEFVALFRRAYEEQDGRGISALFKWEGTNQDGLKHHIAHLIHLRTMEISSTIESVDFPDASFAFEDVDGHPFEFNLEPTKVLEITSASERNGRKQRAIVRLPIGFDGKQFLLGFPVE